MNPNSLKNLQKFKPGASGNPGGRRRAFPKVEEILKKHGVNCVEEILKLLAGLEDDRDKIKVWLELLPYVHAKQRYVEQDDDELNDLSTAELVRLVKDNLPEVG